jgi:hypothetical protein
LLAANNINGKPVSENPTSVARLLPTSSSTAPMSSIQACIAGSRDVSIESDDPVPRGSHKTTRPQAFKRRNPRAAIGSSQSKSIGAVARDAHKMSRPDPSNT